MDTAQLRDNGGLPGNLRPAFSDRFSRTLCISTTGCSFLGLLLLILPVCIISRFPRIDDVDRRRQGAAGLKRFSAHPMTLALRLTDNMLRRPSQIQPVARSHPAHEFDSIASQKTDYNLAISR
ncbi:hypothetical protein GY45DRAFT_975139 [Cubamyces sp. BRFM 1775]|nr:hypothetical protein GY45DRAFT_975139 [Cubamyces sp. BRFM 1775]